MTGDVLYPRFRHVDIPLRWVGISALVHVLALFMGGGAVTGTPSQRQYAITVDIVHKEPETSMTIPAPRRDIEDRPDTPGVVTSLPKPEETPHLDISPRTPAASAREHLKNADDLSAVTQSSARQSFPFDTYFGPNDVEVRAQPINEVLLRYPAAAYSGKIRGVVQFRLYISAHGALDKAELIEAKPRGLFEDAAWDAVKKLRFSPAIKYGRAVASEKTIDVVFDPDDPSPTRQPDPLVTER